MNIENGLFSTGQQQRRPLSLETRILSRQDSRSDFSPEATAHLHHLYHSPGNGGCGVGAGSSNIASHAFLRLALTGAENMAHRAGLLFDPATGECLGDGTGIAFGYDTDFIHAIATDAQAAVIKSGKSPADRAMSGEYQAIGQLYFPHSDIKNDNRRLRELMENLADSFQLQIVGWRRTPVDTKTISEIISKTAPDIWQPIIIPANKSLDRNKFDRMVRRFKFAIDTRYSSQGVNATSLDPYSIIYSGLLTPKQLSQFYPDLTDEHLKTDRFVTHNRYSTNCLPNWRLVQPFPFAQNGEVNSDAAITASVQNYEAWLQANAIPATERITTIIFAGDSDSKKLANLFEALLDLGYSVPEAMRILMPPADAMVDDERLRPFYRHLHAMRTIAPVNGPAYLIGISGDLVFSAIDPNGLRPANYSVIDCGDGEHRVFFSSDPDVYQGGLSRSILQEVGQIPPGGLVMAKDGRMITSDEIDDELYQKLCARGYDQSQGDKHVVHLSPAGTTISGEKMVQTWLDPNLQSTPEQPLIAVGISAEKLNMLHQLARTGKEGIVSQGDFRRLYHLTDAMEAAASSPYDAFRQVFAMVTNPPIDYYREGRLFHTDAYSVPRNPDLGELLDFKKQNIILQTPRSIISAAALQTLLDQPEPVKCTLHVAYQSGGNLEERLAQLGKEAVAAVLHGQKILILDDQDGFRAGNQRIGMLFAVNAVTAALEQAGLRGETEIDCVARDVTEPHQLAVLIGLGANMVCPAGVIEYYQRITDTAGNVELPVGYEPEEQKIILGKSKQVNRKRHGKTCAVPFATVIENVLAGMNDGLAKIMSKMGVHDLDAYRGSALFNVYGLKMFGPQGNKKFTNPIGGLGFAELQAINETQRAIAGKTDAALFDERERFDFIRSPELSKGIDAMLTDPTGVPDQVLDKFLGYMTNFSSRIVHREKWQSGSLQSRWNFTVPMDLLELCFPAGLTDTDIYDVQRLQRFVTKVKTSLAAGETHYQDKITAELSRINMGGMSYGALTPLAWEAIIKAVNTIGGHSCSGEGGVPEDVSDGAIPSIKQVATGRFGASTAYLQTAALQIKIAQGAKPGEGGQLPAVKVTAAIANARGTKEGVGLISPPPHHDIYSIEDLAQLIYDLRSVTSPSVAEKLEYLRMELLDAGKPFTKQVFATFVAEFFSPAEQKELQTLILELPEYITTEDFKQLHKAISNTRKLLPAARIEVKLCSLSGRIGTIAVGVAKAGADVIVIDGHNGGTGAAPDQSRDHAGDPVEFGVVEVHRALTMNGLRQQVKLVSGGGMRTGYEALRLRILGTDEIMYGALMMMIVKAVQCTMARECHNNNCPAYNAGNSDVVQELKVADPKKYAELLDVSVKSATDALILHTIEIIYLTEALGIDDSTAAIGHPEWYLRRRTNPATGESFKAHIDTGVLQLATPASVRAEYNLPKYFAQELVTSFDHALLSEVGDFLSDPHTAGRTRELDLTAHELRNFERSIGGLLAGKAVRLSGKNELPDGREIILRFRGTAGASFGLFAPKGLTFLLEGAAGDYPGKGISGGTLVIKPHPDETRECIHKIPKRAGNLAGLGGKAGAIFVAGGKAGQRIGTLASNVLIVCGGGGFFPDEYRTGGMTVFTQSPGIQIGAGDSGGTGFYFSNAGDGSDLDLADAVHFSELTDADRTFLKTALTRMRTYGDPAAALQLKNWETAQRQYKKIVPKPA